MYWPKNWPRNSNHVAISILMSHEQLLLHVLFNKLQMIVVVAW